MINQVQILGRVGKVESKPLDNGGNVTNISIVTSKKYVKDGEKIEKVVWHSISCYAKLADISEKYVAIGDLLWVQGEINNHKYKGQDGVERIKSYIIAHELKFMPKSKPYEAETKEEPKVDSNDYFSPDIPF